MNNCSRLSPFGTSWKEAKLITLPKPGRDPKLAQNICSFGLMSTTGKLFDKVILKIFKWHIKGKCLLNASKFVFRERHRTSLQCMGPTGHVTHNFNKISMVPVILDIEETFDMAWLTGLLHKLP
jgi:hypothetical protein